MESGSPSLRKRVALRVGLFVVLSLFAAPPASADDLLPLVPPAVPAPAVPPAPALETAVPAAPVEVALPAAPPVAAPVVDAAAVPHVDLQVAKPPAVQADGQAPVRAAPVHVRPALISHPTHARPKPAAKAPAAAPKPKPKPKPKPHTAASRAPERRGEAAAPPAKRTAAVAPARIAQRNDAPSTAGAAPGPAPAPPGLPSQSRTGAGEPSGAAPASFGFALLLIVLAVEAFGLVPPGIGRRLALLLQRPRPPSLALDLERPG